jgi:tetratricopeptide (TPR) repeat protein
MQAPLHEVLQDSLKGCGKEVKALLDEAWAAAQRGEVEQSLGLARKAVTLAPQTVGTRLVLGLCLFRGGHFAEAIDQLDPLPSQGLALLYAGRARVDLAQASQPPDAQKLEDAYRLYQRAEELDPRNGEIPFAMAQIHWLRREDAAALRRIEQAVRADGQLDVRDLEALQMGARIRMRLRNWPAFDDTLRRIERAAQNEPQRQGVAMMLSRLSAEAVGEGGQLSALRAAYLAVHVLPGDESLQRAWQSLQESSPADLVEKVKAEQKGSPTVRMIIPTLEVVPAGEPRARPSSSWLGVSLLVMAILLVFVGLGAVIYHFVVPLLPSLGGK